MESVRPSVPREASPSPGNTLTGGVIVSALLLVLLLAALNLWLNHHFGVGLDRPGVLVPFLGAVGVAWGLVGRLFGKGDLDGVTSAVRVTLRVIFLSPALVAVLWGAFALAVLMWSSVTVVGESADAGIAVTLTRLSPVEPTPDPAGPAEDARRERGEGLVRFAGVTTSPLAGPYVVHAEGYQPAVVEATPFLGARVVLGTDVPRSPALLIRPDEALLEVLRAGGRLEVFRRRGAVVDTLGRVVAPAEGSFLMGRDRLALSDRAVDWERELSAAGVTSSELRNRHIIDWKTSRSLDLDGYLAASDTIITRVVAPSGRVPASAEIVLGGEDVADLFLRANLEDQP